MNSAKTHPCILIRMQLPIVGRLHPHISMVWQVYPHCTPDSSWQNPMKKHLFPGWTSTSSSIFLMAKQLNRKKQTHETYGKSQQNPNISSHLRLTTLVAQLLHHIRVLWHLRHQLCLGISGFLKRGSSDFEATKSHWNPCADCFFHGCLFDFIRFSKQNWTVSSALRTPGGQKVRHLEIQGLVEVRPGVSPLGGKFYRKLIGNGDKMILNHVEARFSWFYPHFHMVSTWFSWFYPHFIPSQFSLSMGKKKLQKCHSGNVNLHRFSSMGWGHGMNGTPQGHPSHHGKQWIDDLQYWQHGNISQFLPMALGTSYIYIINYIYIDNYWLQQIDLSPSADVQPDIDLHMLSVWHATCYHSKTHTLPAVFL